MARKKTIFLITCVIVVVLTVVIICILSRSPVQGKWTVDGVTTYEFRRNGTGTLILPSSEYEFVYSIKEDILYIDFDYEGAKDAQYKFTVEGDVLTMEGGNTTTQGTLTLKKIS